MTVQAQEEADPSFRLSSLETAEPFRDFIGDRAELRVAPKSSIKEFTGRIRGRGNEIDIGSDTRIDTLHLEIEGNNNIIIFCEYTSVKECSIHIGGDTKSGNFRGHDNRVRIGRSTSLSNSALEFKGACNRLNTGEGVYIADRCELFLFGFGCKICIGHQTSATFSNFHAMEIDTSIEIGDDTMIAPWVAILAGDKHPIFKGDSFRRVNSAGSISVGNHVWLGTGTQLLKGARVGDHCIVGAHTTIFSPINYDKSDVLAQNAIIFGMPAKVQDRGVTWSREMFYDTAGMEQYPDACSQSWFHKGHLYTRRANELLAEERDFEAQAIYNSAVQEYERASDHKNDYVYAYSAMGVALIHSAQVDLFAGDHDAAIGNLRSALASFERALQWDSSHSDSDFYQRIVENVLAQLERARTYGPDQAGFLEGIGRAHKTFAEAEKKLIERALETRELNAALSFLDRAFAFTPFAAELEQLRAEIRDRLQQLGSPFARQGP